MFSFLSFSRNGKSGMEIERILLETGLSTQNKKNPVSQRPIPIDVSFVWFFSVVVLSVCIFVRLFLGF